MTIPHFQFVQMAWKPLLCGSVTSLSSRLFKSEMSNNNRVNNVWNAGLFVFLRYQWLNTLNIRNLAQTLALKLNLIRNQLVKRIVVSHKVKIERLVSTIKIHRDLEEAVLKTLINPWLRSRMAGMTINLHCIIKVFEYVNKIKWDSGIHWFSCEGDRLKPFFIDNVFILWVNYFWAHISEYQSFFDPLWKI